MSLHDRNNIFCEHCVNDFCYLKKTTIMIELPKLPYKRDALEPYISQKTIDFHYGQHHAGYVKNLNNLIEGSHFENMNLETIIKNSEGSILIEQNNNRHDIYKFDYTIFDDTVLVWGIKKNTL